jgi:hypothetical protein
MSAWHEILPPMRRVRRRMRLQAALELGAILAVPAAGALLAGVFLWKIHVLAAPTVLRLALGAVAVIALGGLLGALRRVPLRHAARALDRAGGLSDRLGSAFEFGPAATDPFMQAAIADAARHLGQTSPRLAAPLCWPAAIPALGVVLLALLLLLPLRIPVRAVVAAAPPPRAPTVAVDADDLVAERELSRALEREAARDNDPALGDLARELARLLDDLEAGRLTHKEVFERLAELEQKYAAGLDGDFEPLLKELRKLGAELAKEKPTADLGRALREDELSLAKEELDRIAAELKKKPDPKEQAALAKALERAGGALDLEREEEREQKAREALERDRKRLEREQQKSPSREDVKKRLEQKKRELEQLTRDQQRRQEQRRQLEQLSRDLRQAGQQAGAGQRQDASRSAQRAGSQMQRFASEQRRTQASQKLGGQLADLKEMLRRTGQSQAGDKGRQCAGKGKDGQQGGKQGQGQKPGQAQGKKGEFYTRARGGEPKPGDLVMQDQQGDLQMQNPGGNGPPQPGDGQPREGDGQGQPRAGEGHDAPRGLPGNGIGDSHDPNLLGDKTRLRAHHRDVLAPGREGAGPSRAETILSASERGFATRSYKRVYRDYTSVAEEALNREKVPLGFKYYVKRYFRLIMPRE